jgi:catechol 2,3-dioxygenase-like lactoylglutathione lyase family enzyme
MMRCADRSRGGSHARAPEPDTQQKTLLGRYVDPAGTPVDTATPNPGTAHVAFSVPDIRATFDRLRAAGVAIRTAAPVAITA